jgi:hypothetical protein
MSIRTENVVQKIGREMYTGLSAEEINVLLASCDKQEVRDIAKGVLCVTERRSRMEKRETVRVNGYLSTHERSLLAKDFSGYLDVQFVDSRFGQSHALMNKARSLIKVVQRIVADKEIGTGVDMCVVGEGIDDAKKVWKANNVVHSAAPVLSGRDYNRFVGTLGKRFTERMSSNVLGGVNVSVMLGAMTDVYDVKLEEIARFFSRSGAMFMTSAILVPEDLAVAIADVDSYGTPRNVQGCYSYWITEEDGVKIIKFDMNDGSMAYSHDLSTYADLVYTDCIDSERFTVVKNEVARCGLYRVYHWYRYDKAISASPIASSTSENHIYVEVYKFEGQVGANRRDISNYKREFIKADKVDWERLVSALTSEIGRKDIMQFSMKTLQTMRAADLLGRSGIWKGVPVEDQYALCVSAVMVATRIRKDADMNIKRATNYEMVMRGDPGLFSIPAAYNACKALIRSELCIRFSGFPVLGQFSNILHFGLLEWMIDLLAGEGFSPRILESNEFERIGLDDIENVVVSDIGVVEPAPAPPSYEDACDEIYFDCLEEHKDEGVITEEVSVPRELTNAQVKLIQDEYREFLSAEIGSVKEDAQDSMRRIVRERDYIRMSWSDASSKQEEISIFEVRDGSVISFEGEANDTMFVGSCEFGTLHEVSREVALGVVLPLRDGRYIINKDMRVLTSPGILSNLEHLACGVDAKFMVVTGPPGFGKTHYVVNNLYKPGTLVLSMSKGCSKDLAEDISRKDPDYDKCMVKTISSYLMHRHYQSNRIIIEEATLAPFGMVLWAVALASRGQHVDVFLVGDKNQIEFSARREFRPLWQSIPKIVMDQVVFQGTETKRNPADMVALYSSFYEYPVTTSSKVDRSVGMRWINGIVDVPYLEGVTYLVYTQKHIKELVEYFKLIGKDVRKIKVLTPEMAQGKTVSYAIIVRHDHKVVTPYETKNHFVVATSRATHGLVLLTIRAKEDMMIRKFSHVSSGSDLDSLRTNGPVIHHDDCKNCGIDSAVGNWFNGVINSSLRGRYTSE